MIPAESNALRATGWPAANRIFFHVCSNPIGDAVEWSGSLLGPVLSAKPRNCSGERQIPCHAVVDEGGSEAMLNIKTEEILTVIPYGISSSAKATAGHEMFSVSFRFARYAVTSTELVNCIRVICVFCGLKTSKGAVVHISYLFPGQKRGQFSNHSISPIIGYE